MMRTNSLLVLGGARSGKSRYAQALAEASGKRTILIATAQAHDAEMRARIARHAEERSEGWRLIEEPVALAAALSREAAPARIILIDCATLWLSNLMLLGENIDAAAAELARCVAAAAGPTIIVSNEVGEGIVPPTSLGRSFRDAQGLLNQSLARACDAVVEVRAGMPRLLKPASPPSFVF